MTSFERIISFISSTQIISNSFFRFKASSDIYRLSNLS
nr:MAG TPA: hypothetical protein [Caudoviricetes sp.]